LTGTVNVVKGAPKQTFVAASDPGSTWSLAIVAVIATCPVQVPQLKVVLAELGSAKPPT
jgi:hypothetical protein